MMKMRGAGRRLRAFGGLPEAVAPELKVGGLGRSRSQSVSTKSDISRGTSRAGRAALKVAVPTKTGDLGAWGSGRSGALLVLKARYLACGVEGSDRPEYDVISVDYLVVVRAIIFLTQEN